MCACVWCCVCVRKGEREREREIERERERESKIVAAVQLTFCSESNLILFTGSNPVQHVAQAIVLCRTQRVPV